MQFNVFKVNIRGGAAQALSMRIRARNTFSLWQATITQRLSCCGRAVAAGPVSPVQPDHFFLTCGLLGVARCHVETCEMAVTVQKYSSESFFQTIGKPKPVLYYSEKHHIGPKIVSEAIS